MKGLVSDRLHKAQEVDLPQPTGRQVPRKSPASIFKDVGDSAVTAHLPCETTKTPSAILLHSDMRRPYLERGAGCFVQDGFNMSCSHQTAEAVSPINKIK